MGRFAGWMARARLLFKRPLRLPHALAGLGVLAVILVLASTTLTPRPGPGPSPSSSSRPSSTGGSTPSPTDEAWTDLHLAAYQQLADLLPVAADASGVKPNSAFTLRSRSSVPALTLAGGLHVEPTFAFSVRAGSTSAEAQIIPTGPLAPGVRYRFSLDDPTGRVIGTWSYRTGRPLHVVGRTPDDRSVAVPVDSGIEITFDQDGATDVAAHFSILPKVAGTFQASGRTIAFAPTTPLAPSTVYHVTLSAGIAIEGSDQVLDAGSAWSFETAGPEVKEPFGVSFGLPIFEISPSEPAIIGLDVMYDTDSPPPSIPLQAYRLPSFTAARDAAARVLADPGWQQLDSSDLVATAGLTRVVDIKAVPELHPDSSFAVIRLPAPLAAGWYLLDIPRGGRDRQAILQVTNLAAWAMTSDTRTVAWIHDIGTGKAVAGAGLFDPNGDRVATADASGLVDIPTPPTLLAHADAEFGVSTTVATVIGPSGDRLIVALGATAVSGAYLPERNGAESSVIPSDRWWLLMATDRTAYRPTDTVHAWGLIRARDGGAAPASVEIRLRAGAASEADGPWLARKTVDTTGRGVWATDLALTDVPYGQYVIDVVVGGQVVTSTWIFVQDIRKPAFELDVTTDHTAVIEGDPLQVTTGAHFFDFTAAAGLELRVTAFDKSSTVTTTATGSSVFTVVASTQTDGGFDFSSIGVRPANPEEGQIGGAASVVVFPSAAWLKTASTLTGSTITLAGRVTHVDLAAAERQLLDAGWVDDPAGAAFGGRTVTISVVENVPVTRQTGTTYDFIEKRVIPVFETTYHDATVGTYTTTSAPNGTFGLTVAVPNPDHGYTLKLTTKDGQGRSVTDTSYASKTRLQEGSDLPRRPYLEMAGACTFAQKSVPVDGQVDLTMYNGDGTLSAPAKYLFIVAARGIRDAVLQDSPVFHRTFARADLPSLQVTAIRFGPSGYVVTNEVTVVATPESQALTIRLEGDRARYAPGDTATVSITTTGPDGKPVAADVVVRGVDEKLFAIGDAVDIDALGTLLQPIGDGLLQSAATHQVPVINPGDGCGDTTGGREDFKDSIVFRVVATDAAGKGSIAFPLPDDITSWHISATAVDAQLRAGDAATLLPVGLPFFADAVLAPDYLTGERPVLRVRSAGDALASSATVRYVVSSASLLMPATTVDGTGSGDASIQLPALPLGTQTLTIDANVVGRPELHDRLTRTVVVRDSRLGLRTTAVVAPGEVAGVGGPGLTTYVVSDAGRGALFPMISDLSGGGGARFDRALAATIANRLLVSDYGGDPSSLPSSNLDVSRWQRDGVALLPYSSPDLELTALSALVAPELLDHDQAIGALATWATDGDPSRERQIIALAGQAALGADVVDGLDAFDRAALSVRESLWLGLGYLASGDEATARSIERRLLDLDGEELGSLVRLRVGSTLPDSVEATSLLALLAAGVGDPLTPGMLAYLQANPVPAFLPVLHEIGAIEWLLDRLPRQAATFTWTVDGASRAETIQPGGSRAIVVTAAQRAGLRIVTGTGAIEVVATWTAAPVAGALPSSDLVSIKRTVTPDGSSGRTDLVHVNLEVVFSLQAPLGCYDVADMTPSGLAPLASSEGWPDDSSEPSTSIRPWAVDGQRVSWCIDPYTARRQTLTYSARVLSPGTYTWEPALIQSAIASSLGSSTPVSTYTIR
jgi:hypothetical protein